MSLGAPSQGHALTIKGWREWHSLGAGRIVSRSSILLWQNEYANPSSDIHLYSRLPPLLLFFNRIPSPFPFLPYSLSFLFFLVHSLITYCVLRFSFLLLFSPLFLLTPSLVLCFHCRTMDECLLVICVLHGTFLYKCIISHWVSFKILHYIGRLIFFLIFFYR